MGSGVCGERYLPYPSSRRCTNFDIAHNSTTNGDIDGIVNRSSHSEENAVAAPSVELIWRSDDGKLVLSRMRYRDDIPVQRN